MEITRNAKTDVNFSSKVDVRTYLHNWNNKVDIDFTEIDGEGIRQEVGITFPLAQARLVVEELTAKIAKFDKEQAEQKAAEEAEQAEADADAEMEKALEVAEELGVEEIGA